MREDLTELVFVLDRSGSMSGLEEDTIGGFNAMLEKQKEEPGTAIVTTVLFDSRYELLHDRADLRAVKPITSEDYFVRGSTALLDAIGRTIAKTKNAQTHIAEKYRAGKTLFVIMTDGMENASREYSLERVREMIAAQEAKGWEFLFFGANMDAIETASGFNIRADRAVTYKADGHGTRLNFEVACQSASAIRSRKELPTDWKKRIEEWEASDD